MENYFIDAIFYQDSLKANPQLEEPDLGHEADREPKPKNVCLGELDFSVLCQNKPDVNDTADDKGE